VRTRRANRGGGAGPVGGQGEGGRAAGVDSTSVLSGEQPFPAKPAAVLMLGQGWFPDQVGGLDRYFRCLLEHQPEARGIVVGPVSGPADRVVAVSRHDAPLLSRLIAFGAAARREARDAEVVDAHFALYALLPLLSRRVRALPAVVHFQGPWADENVAQGDPSRLRRDLRRALERLVYRHAAMIVVLSSAYRRLLVERYRVSPWRIRVEPPGVDLEHFSPGNLASARARFGLGESPFVAVCVRRLVPRMGLDVLVDAWAQALPYLPVGARLLVAGEGPLAGELERLVARDGLTASLELLGRVDDHGLVDLFRAADVGIVPTRSFEGFGLVVIEAAACGTPTIVTRVGGLPEAVAGLDSSLGVPAGDAPALAARIRQAAGPGGLPTRAATRKFAERHSWRDVADRIRAVECEALTPARAKRRMRVVYLDHVAQLSGGEIALLRLVPHLTEVDPHVILAEDGPFADSLVEAGISTEVLPLAQRARALRKGSVTPSTIPPRVVLTSAAYVVRLAFHLRRMRPDIVHTNSLKAGVYGSIAARLAGIPVVWHIRDRIAPDYLPRSAVWAVRAMARRLPAAVIANSRATVDTLGAHRGRAIQAVIPEAIIAPTARGPRAARPFTVGMVGRLAPWKGQSLFLRAFADAFPDGDVRCVLVGAPMFGEDDYERQLHRLVEELGLDARAEFRGFRTDVWSELARMDLLVHASLIPEPFGQVILEGMAAQLPVVAAAAGGPADLIRHNLNGVLYPMGDRSALGEELHSLATDRPRRLRLIEGGLATVAHHHPNVLATRMQQLYRDVIERAKDPQ
jgi:glycosyltransferase involved in cell wall biosynthesis